MKIPKAPIVMRGGEAGGCVTNYEMNECAMRGELFGLRPHDKAACERAIMAEMMRRMDPAEFWLCMRGVRATVMMPKIIAELA